MDWAGLGKVRMRVVLAMVICLAGCATSSAPAKVVSVSPVDGAKDVDVQAIVQVHFSNGLNVPTITAQSVRLRGPDGAAVAVQLGSDIEADVVNLQPRERLKPPTTYLLETSNLVDRDGVSVSRFTSSFTTGADAPRAAAAEGFRFTKAKVDDENGPTAVALGPDGNIYVATYYGIV